MRRPAGPARRRDRSIVVPWRSAWMQVWWFRFLGVSLPFWWRTRDEARHWKELGGSARELTMKRPVIALNGDKDLVANTTRSKLIKVLPRLDELLCDGTWEDGEAKGDRALMLFVSAAGSVRALVKVQRPPLKLSSLGRSIDESMAALDALLGGNDVPWEHDAQAEGGSKKRK